MNAFCKKLLLLIKKNFLLIYSEVVFKNFCGKQFWLFRNNQSFTASSTKLELDNKKNKTTINCFAFFLDRIFGNGR